jgi:hypothetical protein
VASRYYNAKTVPKWIEALRSGKYKQGREALKRDEGDGSYSYCCLGVWAEVAGDKRLDKAITGMLDEETNNELLSSIYASQERYLNRKLTNELVILNDETRYTFEQIADVLEMRKN